MEASSAFAVAVMIAAGSSAKAVRFPLSFEVAKLFSPAALRRRTPVSLRIVDRGPIGCRRFAPKVRGRQRSSKNSKELKEISHG
jgi:hypothetical protein